MMTTKVYETESGSAYLGDSLAILKQIEDNSVNLVLTSPPFALVRKKAYGNPAAEDYLSWFRPFATEFERILMDDGSLVIEIGGSWIPGSPTRSIYHFELLVELVRKFGFHLAEEFYWMNRAKLPSPAQWVTVERIRVKDAVNPIWWLSKSERPKADNRNVLKPYSVSMERLLQSTYNRGKRPSGHDVGEGFTKDHGGAIPSNLIDSEMHAAPTNLLELSNTKSSEPYQRYCREHGIVIHPARFPAEIPEFFIKLTTSVGDLVVDPFAGSNMTGAVAQSLGRRWIAAEINRDYLQGSLGRFPNAIVLEGVALWGDNFSDDAVRPEVETSLADDGDLANFDSF